MTFADSVSFLFQELSEFTADVEEDLGFINAAVASPANWVFERKRLVVATGGKEVTHWCNQAVPQVGRLQWLIIPFIGHGTTKL